MGPLGLPELIFILVLALLIFGPRRLPEVGRTVGKALGEFRRATGELTRTLNSEVALEEQRPRRTTPTAPLDSPSVAPGHGVATGVEPAAVARTEPGDADAPADAEATAEPAADSDARPAAASPPAAEPDAEPATESEPEPAASRSPREKAPTPD